MYKLNGIPSTLGERTDIDHKAFREAGLNAASTTKGGTCYSLGVVSSNGVSTDVNHRVSRVMYRFKNDFKIIEDNIESILEYDPEEMTSNTLTIGVSLHHKSQTFIYRIKETGVEFHLPK